MNNILKSLTLAPLSFFILACGGAPFEGKVSVVSTKSTLATSKKKIDIDFLFANSYDKAKVEVKDMHLDIPSCEIGTAIFTPNSFIIEPNHKKKVTANVEFTKGCKATSYRLQGIAILSLDGNKREMPFDSLSVKLESTTPSVPSVPSRPDSNTDGNTTSNSYSNNEENLSLPTLVIPNSLQEVKLSTNSQSLSIPIKVFKDISPYTQGSVKVELPKKVLEGSDVGLFDKYEVNVNEKGIAIFNYTGPSNLQSLIESNELGSTFKFYHVESTKSKKEFKVIYEIDKGSYIPIDYSLKVTTQGDKFSMGIPNLQKTFTINVLDKDGNNVKSGDVKFTKIEVATENALIAQLIDNKTKEVSNSVNLDSNTSTTFILNSKKLSGIAPIRVTVEFIDINGKVQKLSTIINVRVMSGPPSAISVSYLSTGQDEARAKYQDKFAVSVTDEYGNKVNTKPYISLGAIVGYAVDGKEASSTETNNTRRLYNAKFDGGDGVIIPGATPSAATFEEKSESSQVFKYVNAEGANSDKLVVFGTGKNYEAMGKWDFSQIDDRTLALQDDYFGTQREGLYYAVGHNYYQDQCQEDGREWLGSTDSDTYQLDEEGTVFISYKYDYHLTGKDALVWVNLSGYQADTDKNTRIGEVVKHTLRGNGLISQPSNGYALDKNTTIVAKFDIHHENAPEWYQNGHFGYQVEATKCSYHIIDTSNVYDARSCNNDGVAYVTFEVSSPVDKECTFNIGNILVADEF